MAMLDAAVRFVAIALLAGTLSCQRMSTTGTSLLIKGKPPACPILGCGKRAKRGVLVVLPATFDPQHPAADLQVYEPDANGEGAPGGSWSNSGTPPGKQPPLDIDLKNIVPGANDKDFAFVAVLMKNPDYYFDTDAVDTDDATNGKFLRAVRVFLSGKLLVFKVKLADAAYANWIDYDLYVMKPVPGGSPLRIKIDPKVKNGG